MIRLQNIKLDINAPETSLREKCAKKLRIAPGEIKELRIFRKSLDAREKNTMFFVYTVDVAVKNQAEVLKRDKSLFAAPEMGYSPPKGACRTNSRPIVVGFGPCGIFAALILAELGLRPVVFERGGPADKRMAAVSDFFYAGRLDESSNVLFGEGGAGAFSDGKLTTRIKDPRCGKVLKEFVLAGAPKDTLYLAKPHIGTDRLVPMVENLRNKIISLGGEVYFESAVTDILLKGDRAAGVLINGEKVRLSEDILLAVGHSARDMYRILHEKGFAMEQKPFAMGVRIEHPQEMIDLEQYGPARPYPADYALTYTTKTGRGVFTFCMCPGGRVIPAVSEPGRLCVNGMSLSARDGENANSAILAQVFPADFGDGHPLAGVRLQRRMERAAFAAGGGEYRAPVQLLGDFMSDRISVRLGEIKPTYKPGYTFCNLRDILPGFVSEALIEALPAMGKKLRGFDRPDAVLTAIESRSSAPVRILRDEKTGWSLNFKGIYPAGEGAGYSGGIMSSAVDGIIAAERIFNNNREEKK